MKNCWLIVMLGMAACHTPGKEEKNVAANQKPGTVIATDSMRIVEDDLNTSYFSVKLLTTDKTDKGTYAIDAAWGFNTAQTEFTMPKGGEKLEPVLRRVQEPYTYEIGFRQEGDTTFYDYYQVKGEKGTIRMKYLKAYSFE